MMVGNDEGGGLQLVNESVGFGEMPVGVGLIPHAVEPDAPDGAIVGEEFGELAIHVGVEGGVAGTVVGTAIVPASNAARVVVRIMPVELRIIEEELEALTVAFIGEHFERIFLIGRALDD